MGQLDQRREIADGKRYRVLHQPRRREGCRRSVFHQHTAWPVGPTPDHSRLTGDIAAGDTIRDSGTGALRSDQRWSCSLSQEMALAHNPGKETRTSQRRGG
jgi:hypothetical protein